MGQGDAIAQPRLLKRQRRSEPLKPASDVHKLEPPFQTSSDVLNDSSDSNELRGRMMMINALNPTFAILTKYPIS
jgi:hypothetical protein